MLKVIINADDLGHNKRVNKSIINLLERDKISSATILSNGKSFSGVIERLKDYKNKSFGVHLNLTEFKPLTNDQIMYDMGLVNDKGFTKEIRNIRINKNLSSAIFLEFEQQICKILDHGVPLTHIDSHNHIHTIPSLFFILKKIQKKFGIIRVRQTMNFYGNFYNPSRKIRLQKYLWNFFLRHYYNTLTSDYFTFAEWFINKIDKHKINRNLTFELMCHPGSLQYQYETELIMSDWLERHDIELISYKDLM